MKKVVSIGNQGFEKLRAGGYFYVDKTDFIREWWEAGDEVTLIARPRRFGKTLNMDMLNCFFSNQYKNRGDLFKELSIWEKEQYRKLQGSYPVIFLSFANVKGDNYKDARNSIVSAINSAYQAHAYLVDSDVLTEGEKSFFSQLDQYVNDISADKQIVNEAIFRSLNNLSSCLARYYGKQVIILLDEYDTPMQEAYVYGFWNEFTSLIRNLFNATFKTNPYLYRAVMTGITRVSKESVFSDLNNLNVVTTTSEEYNSCFGFTEQEVFEALDTFGMEKEKERVKQWYDGFNFGRRRDVYNPWSITCFLDKGQYRTYWASTSSNGLIDRLIRTASGQVKQQMETLLQGMEIVVNFDEQIVFNQLEWDENAIWSLLMASGYLKAEKIEYRGEAMEPWYHLKITNQETKIMFLRMFRDWFRSRGNGYESFVGALIYGDVEQMNYYMNKIALASFSYFDVSGQEPEKFYHGFVLGLMAEQMENYILKSNRESGFGRYDVLMLPKKETLPVIIMEFKVRNSTREKTLEDTVQTALAQIKEKNYDAEVLSLGISKERIFHYGFAFEGKTVRIGKGS